MTYTEYKIVRDRLIKEGMLPICKETIKTEYNSVAVISLLLNKYVNEFWDAVGREFGLYNLLDKLEKWLEKLHKRFI